MIGIPSRRHMSRCIRGVEAQKQFSIIIFEISRVAKSWRICESRYCKYHRTECWFLCFNNPNKSTDHLFLILIISIANLIVNFRLFFSWHHSYIYSICSDSKHQNPVISASRFRQTTFRLFIHIHTAITVSTASATFEIVLQNSHPSHHPHHP